MPPFPEGRYFTCGHCGEQFYRRPSHIKRGITKSCGKSECKSAMMSGPNNPYWGQNHTPETREILRSRRRARPSYQARIKGTGIGHKQDAETRAKISAGLREHWREHRDYRLAACQKSGETQKANLVNHEPRYRRNFTPLQRKEWKADQCLWCDSTEDLVLDHIVPVMCGGTDTKTNAQTLCRKCNLWKMRYIDRPLYLALISNPGAMKLTPSTT